MPGHIYSRLLRRYYGHLGFVRSGESSASDGLYHDHAVPGCTTGRAPLRPDIQRSLQDFMAT